MNWPPDLENSGLVRMVRLQLLPLFMILLFFGSNTIFFCVQSSIHSLFGSCVLCTNIFEFFIWSVGVCSSICVYKVLSFGMISPVLFAAHMLPCLCCQLSSSFLSSSWINSILPLDKILVCQCSNVAITFCEDITHTFWQTHFKQITDVSNCNSADLFELYTSFVLSTEAFILWALSSSFLPNFSW